MTNASLTGFSVLVGLVAVQRLLELRRAAANARAATAAGAVEMGAGHYPWMVTLHSTFLISCLLETWLLRPGFIPPLAVVTVLVLVGATLLRFAAIRTLGERWTTRVYRWPGRPLINAGPYRFLRHPNYLAVRLEILALPLVHSAWITATVFTLLNAWLLRVRIGVEEQALGTARRRKRLSSDG